MFLFTTTIALLVCLTAGNYFEYEDRNDFFALMKMLSKPRVLDRYNTYKYTNRLIRKPGRAQGIEWSNCGASSDPFQMKSFAIHPDPVSLPGSINISFDASTMVSLNSPITMTLTVKKKILFWIEIPCVDQIGSCTLHDVCNLLPSLVCPSNFIKYNIPCLCPFHKGIYKLPMSNIPIPPIKLPDWLKDGEYQVTAKLSSNGQPIGCFFIELSVIAANR